MYTGLIPSRDAKLPPSLRRADNPPDASYFLISESSNLATAKPNSPAME